MLHFQLPIYQTVRELQNAIAGAVPNIPKNVKLHLGADLRREAYWMSIQVRRANKAIGAAKVPEIEGILEQVELVQIMLRDAREHQHIRNHVWEKCLPLLTSVGQQATKWSQKFAPESTPVP